MHETSIQHNGVHFCWHSDDHPEVHVPRLYYRLIIFAHNRFHARILDGPCGRPCRLSNTLFTFSVVRYWTHTLSNSDDPMSRPGHTLEVPSMLESVSSPWSLRANFKPFACQWNAAFSHLLTVTSMLLDKLITCTLQKHGLYIVQLIRIIDVYFQTWYFDNRFTIAPSLLL